MITEAYIKGRFDYGVGKCAVVIVEVGEIVSQRAWVVPDTWDYKGDAVEADQFNCEILAACYALKWCIDNDRKLVNLYANTTTCQKWYFNGVFPESREVMGKAFKDMRDDLQQKVDGMFDHPLHDVVYAEYIPKKSDNIFNKLTNELAENVK